MRITKKTRTRVKTDILIEDEEGNVLLAATTRMSRELTRQPSSRKIALVKMIRAFFGVGLQEAKDFSEALEAAHDYFWEPEGEEMER